MSTYNGHQYLKAQLDSIIRQKDIDVSVLIRDDGSQDDTIDILQDYSKRYPNIQYLSQDNLGAADSFMWLLFNCPLDFDYYAFSDQDDIWKSEKLAVAVDKLSTYTMALYHGYAERVDSKLQSLGDSEIKIIRNYKTALFSSAVGCTMVITKPLLIKLREYYPEFISMHDAWIYRVAYYTNSKVIYDSDSYIYYRQHGTNVTGGELSAAKKIKRQMVINKNVRLKTAKELYKGYGKQITSEKKEYLEKFIYYKDSIVNRLKFAFSNSWHFGIVKTDIQYIGLFLLGAV